MQLYTQQVAVFSLLDIEADFTPFDNDSDEAAAAAVSTSAKPDKTALSAFSKTLAKWLPVLSKFSTNGADQTAILLGVEAAVTTTKSGAAYAPFFPYLLQRLCKLHPAFFTMHSSHTCTHTPRMRMHRSSRPYCNDCVSCILRVTNAVKSCMHARTHACAILPVLTATIV